MSKHAKRIREREESLNKMIGTEIKALRKRAGLTQSDAGKAFGLHQAAICRLENGGQSLMWSQWVIMSTYYTNALERVGQERLL